MNNAVWWQGGLMEIKARAEDTGGALGAVVGSFFDKGYGPPLHVHSREEEAAYVLEGQIRFRRGEDEVVVGPGTWVWQPRGVPHSFSVESESARVLFVFSPGGLERMFLDGGTPAGDSPEPPQEEHPSIALAESFGFEVVGPPLA
jgi:quercetin dioxygenase-like cupin family protein